MKVNLKYWLLKCKEVWPLWEYWQRHNISLFSEHSHIPGSLSSCNLHTFSAPFQSSTLHEVTDGHLHYIPLAWVLQQLSIKLLFALRSPLLSIDDRRQQSPRSSPPPAVNTSGESQADFQQWYHICGFCSSGVTVWHSSRKSYIYLDDESLHDSSGHGRWQTSLVVYVDGSSCLAKTLRACY